MRVPPIEGHRLWAPVYDSDSNPILALERRSMWELLEPLQPSTMLDVACGTGRWLTHFQQAGWQVFGCDASEEMLGEARRHPSLRERVTLADAASIPFGNSTADLVLCSVSLGYFQDIARVFREFARVSTAGGLIAVSDLHPDGLASGWTRSFNLGEHRYEIEHYSHTLREIDGAALGAGLRTKFWYETYFGDPEFPIFQRTGKGSLFRAAKSVPALFIGQWERPC